MSRKKKMYLASGMGEDFFTLSSLTDADCSDLSLLSVKEEGKAPL